MIRVVAQPVRPSPLVRFHRSSRSTATRRRTRRGTPSSRPTAVWAVASAADRQNPGDVVLAMASGPRRGLPAVPRGPLGSGAPEGAPPPLAVHAAPDGAAREGAGRLLGAVNPSRAAVSAPRCGPSGAPRRRWRSPPWRCPRLPRRSSSRSRWRADRVMPPAMPGRAGASWAEVASRATRTAGGDGNRCEPRQRHRRAALRRPVTEPVGQPLERPRDRQECFRGAAMNIRVRLPRRRAVRPPEQVLGWRQPVETEGEEVGVRRRRPGDARDGQVRPTEAEGHPYQGQKAGVQRRQEHSRVGH